MPAHSKDSSGSTARVAAAVAAASETRALELGPGALMAVPRLFELAFPGKSAVVAADPRTFHAAGLRVLDSFRKAAGSDQAARKRFRVEFPVSRPVLFFSFIYICIRHPVSLKETNQG